MLWPALLFLVLFCGFSQVNAQDTIPESKHAAIFFPYPMYTEKWRSSIGFTLLTTPEDITEQVRVRVPAIDFRVLRRINPYFIAEGRATVQVLQNQFIAGLRFTTPLSGKLFFAAGAHAGYWFGFLSTAGFDSKGSGWLAYPSISLGYKTKRNLLITVAAQSSVNLAYSAYNGNQKSSEGKVFYNGETFTIALEQPFYHHKHLSLAFSAINNYFYWQTWSLFYRVNRKVFYPQITVGFIL